MMRKRVFKYIITDNHSVDEAVAHWKGRGPGLKTIERWEKEFIQSGTYTVNKRPNKRGNHRVAPHHVAALEEIYQIEPRRYLDEAQDLLEEKVGRRYDTSTIWRTLHAPEPHGLGRTWHVLQRRARESDEAERQLFLDATRGFPPELMIWLDESHVAPQSCNRKRGYQRRGQGRHHYVLENFGPATARYSLLAAANIDGFIPEACESIEGGVDAERFVKWVTQRLCPVLGSLARGERNSVVVMDNASVHHSLRALVEALVRECGAIIIFLSPYSPDLNPIEQCFKHLKAYFKRHLGFGRERLALGLRSVTPAHMRAFCRHSGIAVVEPPTARQLAHRRTRRLALALLLILD
jgi:transposase